MAFDAGSVVAHFKADLTQFQNGLKQAKEETNGLKDRLESVGNAVNSFAQKASVLSAVAGAGLTLFLKQSSEEANNFAKAMTTLEIISGRFGVSADDAKQAAQTLGKELRIGVGPAAESIQNLLKSGLNLEQSTELLRRFTNEAITGKSPQISLAQAVQNLSFAYNTQNSALGNMSGVSENFQDIIERGRQSLLKQGKAAKDITDDMAKFEGMMQLTNLTLGSSERFTGTLIDKQAMLDQRIQELKVSIGMGLNPVMAAFIDFVTSSGIIDRIEDFAKQIGAFAKNLAPLGTWINANKELVTNFFIGVAAGISAILILAPLLVVALNPFILVFASIAIAAGLLATAWSTNFMGIRDITQQIVTEVTAFFNEYLLPALIVFRDWWVENWPWISVVLKSAWDIMIGIITVAWAIIYGIIKIGLALIAGDWEKAWEAFIQMLDTAWKGILSILNGAIGLIKVWAQSMFDQLTKPFRDAWQLIQETVNKIKDALDFTKRHSPSVLDIVQIGVRKVNDALSDIAWSTNIAPKQVIAGAALAPVSGGMINQITLDLNGAIISDDASATRIGEIVGDSIIRKLQQNVKF